MGKHLKEISLRTCPGPAFLPREGDGLLTPRMIAAICAYFEELFGKGSR